jgi:hypothetical protein
MQLFGESNIQYGEPGELNGYSSPGPSKTNTLPEPVTSRESRSRGYSGSHGWLGINYVMKTLNPRSHDFEEME